MLTPALESLLLRLRPRLRRRCAVAASTRPGLVTDDLEQDAFVLFAQRAPRWFAKPTETSVEARAWTLLTFCLRNLVTDFDRAHERAAPLPRDTETGADLDLPDVSAFSDVPPPSAEARIEQAEADAYLAERLATLTNPTYRMVLEAVCVPRFVTEAGFAAADAHRAGGAETFRRPWRDAHGYVVVEREVPYATSGAPTAREAWRRFVARCVRFDGDPRTGHDPAAAATQNWLDRTLSRAREALGIAAREEG